MAYHAWHQTFDKALRDTEENLLVPALGRLLTGLVTAARTQAVDLAGTAEQRLTDEEWRSMLLEGSQPERPAWQTPLFASLG